MTGPVRSSRLIPGEGRVLGDMPGERCERCELLVDAGCACDEGRGRRGPTPVERILISRNGKAHLPEQCNHWPNEDYDYEAAGWGWVPEPRPGLWELIAPDRPLRATAGDTSLVARERCRHCSA
ncbi:hypothetical protein [Streptomyces mayteni]